MNYYVECKTKEEAKRLQEYLEKTRPTMNYYSMECYWRVYKVNTIYRILDNNAWNFASRKDFEKEGITDFISVDEYINRDEEQPKKYLVIWSYDKERADYCVNCKSMEDVDKTINDLIVDEVLDIKLYEITKEYNVKVDTKIIKKLIK